MTVLENGQAAEVAMSTQALQMIRGSVDIRSFQRWAGSRQLMSRHAFDEGYAMHCFLTGVFGDLAPKPFRLIFPKSKGNRPGVFYGYIRASAAALQEAAEQFADPLQARVMPSAGLDGKPMPPIWKEGTRLGFELLSRPTIRRARGSENAGAEVDAFQWEAEHYPRGTMPRTREEVYTDWLSRQFRRHGGAELDPATATLASFQRTRSVRKRRRMPFEAPTALMRGAITITDSEQFTRLLARGIGRHRAYGYGMLLLRPAARPG